MLQVRVRWAKKSLQYKSRLFTSIIYKFIFSKMAFAQYDVHCELKPPQSDVKQSAHSVDWQSTKKSVSERNRHMFNNSDMSDISFTCEGSDKILYAHKYVLGTSSAVFRAMFYGDLAEKNSIVHLSDTDVKSLEEFLRFLYTDACNLTTDNVISVMYLSKKYIVPSLTEKCVNNLASSIKAENVMSILEQATHFDESKLEMSCWQFIKSNTKQAVASTDFNNVSQKTLASLLRLNELNIVEVELFRAVLKWSNFQCSKRDIEATRENRRSVIGDAIYDLRFLAMNEKEFSLNVATSGLLTAEEIVPIYTKFNGIYSPGLKWKLSDKRSISDISSEKRSMNDKITEKRCVPMSDDLKLAEKEKKPEEGYFYRKYTKSNSNRNRK
jgi:hypothetical protein